VRDRREDQKFEANDPAPPKPEPAPVPPTVPGPIPWIPAELVSEVPPVHGPTPRWR
jgi:hypothetical protein